MSQSFRSKMFGKKPLTKSAHESSTSASGPKGKDIPEVALAAILSYKKQKEVTDFMSFCLGALERNSDWLNGVVGKQTNFRCALMVGAGPNRLQLQDIIYPTSDKAIQLEVEHRDSEDHDKIAIAAVLNLTSSEMDYTLKYINTRLCENSLLIEDLIKAKDMGVSFAVLRPFGDNLYRIIERLNIGSYTRCNSPLKKRKRAEKSFSRQILKKSKRVVYGK